MSQYDLCVSLILRGVFGTWGVGIFLSRPPTRLIADSADASVSSESSTSLAEEGGTDTTGIRLQEEFTLDSSVKSYLCRGGKEYPNGIHHFHSVALSTSGMSKDDAFEFLMDNYWIIQQAVLLLDGAQFKQALEERDPVLPAPPTAMIPTTAAPAATPAFNFHGSVHGRN
jgi:hypothetical protein